MPQRRSSKSPGQQPGKTGRPKPTHATAAEDAREAQASEQAHNAEASNRERMVDIGRGNQQAGRQRQ